MKLEFDKIGQRFYETGVSNCVLFPMDVVEGIAKYQTGVAWNGITGITDSPSGAEPTKLYADNLNYITLRSIEEFGGTIEAYTYPEEWEECDGSKRVNGAVFGQQSRKKFGLAYITKVGNDTQFEEYGEKLHLVYNATASVSQKAHNTINESPEAATMSWDFQATSVPFDITGVEGLEEKDIEGLKPVSHIVLDWNSSTSSISSDAKKKIYDMIFGTNASSSGGTGTDPTLPSPAQVLAMVKP